MALLDKAYKQRMVGALVLIAIAVIFLPMLFSRQDEARRVQVDAPAAPQAPATSQLKVEPVSVPEQQPLPQEPVPTDDELTQPAQPIQQRTSQQPPAMPIAPAPAPSKPVAAAPKPVQAAPAKPAPAPTPTPAPAQAPAPVASAADTSRVDANGLSVTWAVQLASLSNRANADNLQKTLRTQGYNAYIRTSDGVNRVFVGPVIERVEADRLRDTLEKQQKIKGIVVRFQPERK
ncbi:SPOR domain-containing protein [Pseudomonas petrae]|uniref:SPOR domain-containing protein n=1 Tax=Pseudomonas petrae TaxID=2912190 RepID=A0ABS9I7V7_9PSED|nr:SPOR domain-containing protein [Pseudomonas petrae]MCF7533968.1 SPOR domain-containing protein [Pseudomonas petrae]MCF7539321.1 SPOR domain-containing protein [Pseudomonas petrae]MCF7543551.1 SPOR domain-containing protein [Pseudomonas petrae]MCF7557206.1 SPOR domain-containing protein [Pseudomonas petrae]